MGFSWVFHMLLYVYPRETMGFLLLLYMSFRGQAEEKRAEKEMEELERHRVAWPEPWGEMGVSEAIGVPHFLGGSYHQWIGFREIYRKAPQKRTAKISGVL